MRHNEVRPLRNRSALFARLLGEFTVIVLGVLAALAADRWNQGRLDQQLAASYPARLVAELTADSLRLEAHRREADRAIARGLALLEVVQSTAPDSTGRRLYYGCSAGALPHPGGATFNEIQNTGGLRLLSTEVQQTLFDYYGFVGGIRGRIEDARRAERTPYNTAGNQSGAWMPRDRVSQLEFTERLRAYPNVEGLIQGCVAYQRGANQSLVGSWIRRLGEVLETVRAEQAG